MCQNFHFDLYMFLSIVALYKYFSRSPIAAPSQIHHCRAHVSRSCESLSIFDEICQSQSQQKEYVTLKTLDFSDKRGVSDQRPAILMKEKHAGQHFNSVPNFVFCYFGKITKMMKQKFGFNFLEIYFKSEFSNFLDIVLDLIKVVELKPHTNARKTDEILFTSSLSDVLGRPNSSKDIAKDT